jgi:hypothetical protein
LRALWPWPTSPQTPARAGLALTDDIFPTAIESEGEIHSLLAQASTGNAFEDAPPKLTEADELAAKIEKEAEFLASHSEVWGRECISSFELTRAGGCLSPYGTPYRMKPERAWQELLELSDAVEKRVTEVEHAVAAAGSNAGIAITEGHLSLSPPNSNPILNEWLSAAHHARSLNIYQRHGASVKIATAADFQGNRWTNTAVMLPTPRGRSFLMPVGSIARLFKTHNGTQGVAVRSNPSGLDIAASRSDSKFYLHVGNLEYQSSVQTTLAVEGMRILAGRIFEIAPEDLRTYVNQDQPDVFQPRETQLPADLTWRFPAGSVSAIELDVQL